MSNRVLETVLTGRNLLSPVLTKAAGDVTAFNSTIAKANTEAATSAARSAEVQKAASTSQAASAEKAAAAAAAGAGVQTRAGAEVTASNVRASESATVSANTQARAHAKAAESASLSSKVQSSASNALARSNGLLGTSLTPLTAGLGAVALGLGYAAFAGMNFDKSMSQVQAATQANSTTMGQLRQAAIQAGAATKYSSTEAAAGITELAKAGVSTNDILRGGLVGALNLAAAGQISVADAATIGATALNVFNLSGDQMSHVADLLAAGAGKAQGSVGDLSMALNQSALVAKNTGLSIETTTGALALFASNGLLGSDAGTSFKTMLMSLNPRSQQAADLMDQLGLRAYDASGKFVGLSGYADKLKSALGGMSQEQRNATLQTIFGSDAVRAATILYQSGGAGVDQWTKKVNDAGYASRQASQLQNNLAGDLEKLGGSMETLFTTIGGGAQGPLRMLAQGLTQIVNAGVSFIGFWNNIPGPVKIAITALAGIALLKGPVSTAFSVIAGNLRVLTGSIAASGGVLANLKSGMGGLLGVFGGPWGLALTGATVGLSLLFSWLGKNNQATQALTSAEQSYASALEQANGAIDKNVRQAAAKAAQDAGLLDIARSAGIQLSVVTDAITGQGTALDQTRGQLKAFIDSHTHLVAVATGKGGAPVMRQALDDEGKAAQGALAALNGLAGTTTTTAAKQGELATATAATGTAMVNGQPVVQDYATKLQNAADAANAAKQNTDLLKLSLDLLTGKTVDMSTVEAAFYDAVSKADGAMKGLHGSVLNAAGGLNAQSEAGRKAQSVLFGVRDSGNQLIATMEQQGATSQQVLAKDAQLRAGFIASARQMGISAGDAQNLANKIYGIPAERRTQIIAATAQATAAVANLKAQIDGLHDRTISIITRSQRVDVPGVQRFGAATGGSIEGGRVHHYDSGGAVHGAGGPTADLVAALGPDTGARYRLSNGEHIWTAAEVNAAGGQAAVAQIRKLALAGAFNPAGIGFHVGPAAAMPGYGMGARGWGGGAPVQVVERSPQLTYVDQRPNGTSAPDLMKAWGEMEFLHG